MNEKLEKMRNGKGFIAGDARGDRPEGQGDGPGPRHAVDRKSVV